MSRDLQRVARGLGMIAMEAARTQGPEAMQCMRSTAHNVQGFLRSLEAAARAYRGGSGSHAPSSAAGDAAEATDLFAAGAGADPAASSWQQQQQQQPQQPPTLAAAHAPAPPAMDLAVAAGLKAEPLPAAPPAFSAPAFDPPPPPPAPPLAQQQQQQQQQQQPASAAPLAAAEPPPAPPAPRKKRVFREVSVPASPLARLWGFGSLAASMAAGAVGEALVSAVSGGRRPSADAEAAAAAPSASAPALSAGAGAGAAAGAAAAAPPPPARDTSHQIHLSPAQAERLAEGLCRLRGAALKLGQMLSLADEALIPPSIAAVLERVRSQADVMPTKQLHAQLAAELGEGWRARLGGEGFGEAPVAAASIGQVHRALLSDGRAVAVKVQYPGVAESIDSDLDNLKRLLTYANFLPKGLYLDPMVEVARAELRLECDYEHEAAAQRRYKLLVAADPDFVVPGVVDELSTRRVLTTTWLPGVPIDQVVEATGGLGQEDRNRIARKLLKLTLKELFEWRYMQVSKRAGPFFSCGRARIPPPPPPSPPLPPPAPC